jgi:methylmalonyl-CoA mutase C-terminal domain/subunit
MARKIRVLVGKPGLDGHDRGAKTVVHALRDAGFEVIYTGLHKTVDQIVATALEQEVDVIGLSIMSGAHIPIAEEIVAKTAGTPLEGKPLLVGGVIPEKDVPRLEQIGVDGVFPVSSPFEDIVRFIEERANVG